ncbi:gas vesicle protein [Streptomyces mirabilis]|uniref:gas vesicle protein n=1 Tax=Streptomyces mirabilis TaxID=68239 RepID=UPI0036B71458
MTTPGRMPDPYGQGSGANLADILERVLDKGIVIAGDIRINLLDIELPTIKLRLIVASVDKAKEMGIDWWEDDPALSSRANHNELARENAELRAHLAELEQPGQVPRGKAEETA